MQVVKVKLEKNKERYYIATDDGIPIEAVFKFIKFKDNTGYARNTLKQYCWHLKLYFEYLEQRKLDFQKVTIIVNAKNKSTEQNNPKKYLFNTYTGKSKGRAIRPLKVVLNIRKMIEEKNILDANGKIYHFKLHSLRHTRAKEYVEQGLGIEIVQQMLGHRSLQMTVHYATVSENILYEKWKATEKLQLFKVNAHEKQFEEIDINNEQNDKIIRYEYVKENLEAVKVPFGVCFKSKKLQCKNQINQCLECSSFCTTIENSEEYEKEIIRIKRQIEIAQNVERTDWIEKNVERLKLLEQYLEKIKAEKMVHKNGNSREEC